MTATQYDLVVTRSTPGGLSGHYGPLVGRLWTEADTLGPHTSMELARAVARAAGISVPSTFTHDADFVPVSDPAEYLARHATDWASRFCHEASIRRAQAELDLAARLVEAFAQDGPPGLDDAVAIVKRLGTPRVEALIAERVARA